jgi:predicted N-formylglutamate amidohydrolase
MDSFAPSGETEFDSMSQSLPAVPVDETPDIEIFNPEGRNPVLILSDHSGRRIPKHLDDLGLSEDERSRHIAYDIGTTEMTRRLAKQLDASAVLNHISRLVIDPNRLPHTPTSIPEISDGTVIPGNRNLSKEEIDRRIRFSFLPYHRAISQQLARLRRGGAVPAVIAMHSFTPAMQKEWRPWEAAVLWSAEDNRLAMPVLEGLRGYSEFCIGANQPYSGDHPDGYSLQFHALRTGFPNVAFEVRQDQISTQNEAEAWADRLHKVLQPALSDPTLYRRWGSWRRLNYVDCAAVTDAGSRRRIPAG